MLSRRTLVLSLIVVLCVLGTAWNVLAQGDPIFEQGFKPFGSFQGGEIDTVNLLNGKIGLHIPLFSYPQRGGVQHLDYHLDYAGPLFLNVETDCGGGAGHCFFYTDGYDSASSTGPSYAAVFGADNFQTFLSRNCAAPAFANTITGPDGSTHLMDGYSTLSSDGTAYGAAVNTSTPPGCGVGPYTDSLTDRRGIRHTFGYNGVNCFSYYEDPNGNKITQNMSTQYVCAPTNWTDTMGRTLGPTSASADTSGCRGTLPTVGANLVSFPGFGLGSLTFKFCYAQVLVNVPGACNSNNNCLSTPSATFSLVQSIVLPDTASWSTGSAWVFQWDSAPNLSSTGYGDLLKITLPTGGSISYAWQSLYNVCSSGNYAGRAFGRSLVSRTLDANDGTGPHMWRYTLRSTPGATTVLDPNGNQTVHTFSMWGPGPGNATCQTFYETQTQVYQGTAALLKTVTTNYVPAAQNGGIRAWDAPGGLVSRVTTAYADGQQTKVEMDYEYPALDRGLYPLSDGNVITKREYDYASGAPGALLRTISKTYLAASNTNYISNNLWDLVSSITVKNGAGTVQSTAGAFFDEYSLVSSGITTQHDSAPPSGIYRGNQTSIRNWLNGSTTSTANCPISVSNGFLVSYSVYNDTGTLDHTVDPCGTSASDANHKTTYTYGTTSTCNQNYFGAFPTIIKNPLTHATNFCYDFNTGLTTSTTDPNGQTTSNQYDNMLRLTSVSYPDGGSASYSYNDAVSYPSSPNFTLTKKINSVTNFVQKGIVDGLGRQIETQLTSDPDGTVYTETSYDNNGRKYKVWNPTRCSPPRTNNCESTWGFTTYNYDALNRVTSVVEQDGNTVATSYTGNCTTMTDEAQKSRRSCSDGMGRMTSVWEDPNGLNYQSIYTYDALDNLTCAVQKGADTTAFTTCGAASVTWRPRSFVYDSLSRLTSAVNPESGTIGYTYDVNGNLLTKTDARGISTNYTYDALNRVKQKSYTDGTATVKYGYDAIAPTGCTLPTLTIGNGIGNRTGMCDAAGAEAWSRDIVSGTGWKTTDARTTNGITKTTIYQNNLDGSLDTLTYPGVGEVLTFAVGGAGKPLSAVGLSTYATGVHYASTGALCSFQTLWGNTFTHTYLYNNRLQPTRININGTGYAPNPPCSTPTQGNLLDLVYAYVDSNGHNNGNVVSETNNGNNWRNQTFTYDSLNRVSTAQTAAVSSTPPPNNSYCWGEQFGYDTWGNMSSISGASSAYTGCTQESLSVSASTKNQLSGNVYDAAGDLTSIPGIASYNYDAESRLCSVGGTSCTTGTVYTYDGDGKRVMKSGGKIYWYGTGSDPLIETDLSGAWQFTHYYFGGMRIARRESNNWVDHYGLDHLGNARIVYGNNGGWDQSDFYPFGGERVISSQVGSRYKFTGKERDSESNLDYFGARYMSSQYGRFMTPDSAVDETLSVALPYAELSNPQSLNLYSYVRNNPLSFTDPDGQNVNVCVDDGNGKQQCQNYTDEQYQKLYNAQNGQQGINLPGGQFPRGNITCGGQTCGSATYNEAPLEDQTAGMVMGYEGGKLGGILLGKLAGAIGGMLGKGAGELAGETASQGGAKVLLSGGSKQAAKEIVEGLADGAQKASAKRAIAAATRSEAVSISESADGTITVTRTRAGFDGCPYQ